MIGVTALDEIHRHIQRPFGIAVKAHAALEGEGDQPRTVGIGMPPDFTARRQKAGGLAVHHRRIGKQSGGNRLQGQTDPHFLDHIRFGREIEIDLHRGGAEHHIKAHRADFGHVIGHDLVTALRHHRRPGA